MLDTGPVLTCTNVEKYFGSKGGLTKALDGISFSVDRGEFIGIMGPSGSGKTTLLNCIATIDRVTAGRIIVGGSDVTSLRSRELARFRREQLGFIFQDSNLLDTLTARENIALGLTISRVPASQVAQRVDDVAKRLSITDTLDKFPYQLSGGQKQRVAAARAIVCDPALVLADEPTGALDSRNAAVLLESLQSLNMHLQTTILMVTHDPSAASYADRILFIKDGKIFNEIRRGEAARREFFNKIMDVMILLGGEAGDAL